MTSSIAAMSSSAELELCRGSKTSEAFRDATETERAPRTPGSGPAVAGGGRRGGCGRAASSSRPQGMRVPIGRRLASRDARKRAQTRNSRRSYGSSPAGRTPGPRRAGTGTLGAGGQRQQWTAPRRSRPRPARTSQGIPAGGGAVTHAPFMKLAPTLARAPFLEAEPAAKRVKARAPAFAMGSLVAADSTTRLCGSNQHERHL